MDISRIAAPAFIPFPLQALPDEIIVDIFAYLPKACDRSACALLNKKFYRLVVKAEEKSALNELACQVERIVAASRAIDVSPELIDSMQQYLHTVKLDGAGFKYRAEKTLFLYRAMENFGSYLANLPPSEKFRANIVISDLGRLTESWNFPMASPLTNYTRIWIRGLIFQIYPKEDEKWSGYETAVNHFARIGKLDRAMEILFSAKEYRWKRSTGLFLLARALHKEGRADASFKVAIMLTDPGVSPSGMMMYGAVQLPKLPRDVGRAFYEGTDSDPDQEYGLHIESASLIPFPKFA